MITVLAGTNRPNSNSLKVAHIAGDLLKKYTDEDIHVLDLKVIPLQEVDGAQYSKDKPQGLAEAIELLNKSDGIVIVCPEYNGSYPGVLKYFIDHFEYPTTFEHRPVAFIGLGGKFGGLRPVEHLQGVFGYRNAYMFPERIFLTNVWNLIKENKVDDEVICGLMDSQAKNFVKFIKALKSEGLDANSRLQS